MSEITVTETKTTIGQHGGEARTGMTRRTHVRSDWMPMRVDRMRDFASALEASGLPPSTPVHIELGVDDPVKYLTAWRELVLDPYEVPADLQPEDVPEPDVEPLEVALIKRFAYLMSLHKDQLSANILAEAAVREVYRMLMAKAALHEPGHLSEVLATLAQAVRRGRP